MSDLKDFVIEDGVLTKYVGPGGDVVIPEGIKVIDSCAFEKCTDLITINITKGVKNICDWAFEGCSNLTTVTIPDSVNSLSHTSFKNCTSLANVTVPENISVKNGVFKGCKGLADAEGFVIINNVLCDYLGTAADVIIPSTVTCIGNFVFEGCTNITTVTIPDGVTNIGYGAFCDCTNLSAVNIPNTVMEIDRNAFDNCTSLTSITFPKNLKRIKEGVFKNCTSLTKIVIPDGITEIKDMVFMDCTALSEITIPDSLVTVWKDTFKNCNRLSTIIASSKKTYDIIWKRLTNKQKQIVLRKIILGKSMDQTALHRIKANKNILIDFAVENDDAELLSRLFALFQKIDLETLDHSIAAATNAPQAITFLMDYKQKYYTYELLEKEENRVNEKILGIRENTIADWKKIYIFKKCRGGIEINNYKGNDDYVDIPKTIGKDKIVAIGYEAFSPEAQRLNDISRKRRESITTIIIPDSVKRFDSAAFSGCKALTSITLPKNLTEIGMFAFRKCTSLTSVIIPSHVKKLDYGAFYQCTSLVSITLPKSVESIDICVFEGCHNLTIHAPAGSYAEQYAKENNIPFVAE